MHTRVTSILAVLMLILATLAAGTALARPSAPVGEQLDLLITTPVTFPADTPFHVSHGWHVANCEDPVADFGAIGSYQFWLEVDGVSTGRGIVQMSRDESGCIGRRMLTEFPDGLPVGTHSFTAQWLLPCQLASDAGSYVGECPSRNAPVVVHTTHNEIAFTS